MLVHQIQQNFPLLSQEDGKGVLDLPITPPHRNEQFPKMCTTEMVNTTLMLLFYEFNKGEVINGVLRSWNPFYEKSKLHPFLTLIKGRGGIIFERDVHSQSLHPCSEAKRKIQTDTLIPTWKTVNSW